MMRILICMMAAIGLAVEIVLLVASISLMFIM